MVYSHLVVYGTVILTVALFSALAAVVMYRVLVTMTSDRYFAVLAIMAIWLGTIVFPFSTVLFGHQIAAAALVVAFYLLFDLRRGSAIHLRRAFINAVFAGLLWVSASRRNTQRRCLLGLRGGRILPMGCQLT
jgi:hypothetical protein